MKCIICHCSFTSKAHNALYCSDVCRKIAKTKQHNGWYQNNLKHVKEYDQKYYSEHKSKRIEHDRLYRRHKMKTDIQYRLRQNLRKRLCKAISNNQKAGSAVADLGCSVAELKTHLESKFQEGMNWNNYGKGVDKWNIDHIIPLSSFDLTNPDEFKKACHYTNLQPMWETDNLAKYNRIDH